MEELIKVLDKTVISSSQEDRNEAVKYLQEFCQRDLTGFLTAISDVLHNNNNSAIVRAAAGLQLKNQLTAHDDNLKLQQQERWRRLPESCRLHVKNRVFQALGTELFRPPSAPQCVAYIAMIELPANQWPGIIPALADAVANPESAQQLKLASLEALGHICQDIDQSCLQPSDAQNILTAIVQHGMRDDESDEVKRAATSALLNLCESRVKEISKTSQSITFAQLGERLGVLPEHAEKIVAQMIREERLKGHLNQIEGVVHFDSKDVLQVFDDEILTLCGDVNVIIEKIKRVVPDEWWSQNFNK